MKELRPMTAYIAQSKNDGKYFEIRNHNGVEELIVHTNLKLYERAGYNPKYWNRIKVKIVPIL
jgi:hypothetical protein